MISNDWWLTHPAANHPSPAWLRSALSWNGRVNTVLVLGNDDAPRTKVRKPHAPPNLNSRGNMPVLSGYYCNEWAGVSELKVQVGFVPTVGRA